jgi:ankyrin repeat protein
MSTKGPLIRSGYYFIKNDDSEGLKLALERENRNSQLEAILLSACRNNAIKVVSMLLVTPNIEVSCDDEIILRTACDSNHTEIVNLLLLHRQANPCFCNNYIFNRACRKGKKELTSLLLKDRRVDPSDQNCAAFDICLKSKNIEIIKLLLNDDRIYTHRRFNILYEVIKYKNYFEVGEETIIGDIIYTIASKLVRFTLE